MITRKSPVSQGFDILSLIVSYGSGGSGGSGGRGGAGQEIRTPIRRRSFVARMYAVAPKGHCDTILPVPARK
jgi:hypothetical protein